MDDKKAPASLDLSVVIPAYNEQDCIADCVDEVKREVDRLDRSFEIVVVDDGSEDDTPAILRGKVEEIPELRMLRFSENNGQSAAFDAGLRAARGRVIVTMDADLQNDPADIGLLLEECAEADVVCGVRQKRRDSFVRKASSRIANGVRNWLTNESIQDVGCSLRAMKRECVEGLKLFEGMHRFLPTLLRMDGWTIKEVPVNHRPRPAGETKYGIGNRLFRGVRDLIAVRWMQKRWLNYEIEEEIE
jgi:glycosyltransferase involved in cell wall biosynthesis